ncbi:hypothetical protein GF380_04600 [Candidatus Uhrbacteria bacterium]|nr:hypothetical protein [Candidatus Uhrbacteria bacterium]
MVPLGYFLIAWLILLGIFAFFVLFTLIQMLRHGLPGMFTYLSTFLFVAVIVLVVLGSGLYFLQVDWNDSVSIIPESLRYLFGGGNVVNDTVVDIPL